MTAKRVVVRMKRSAIGEKRGARATLAALGLRHVGEVVTHTDSPALRGMLRRVAHLVAVEGTDAAA